MTFGMTTRLRLLSAVAAMAMSALAGSALAQAPASPAAPAAAAAPAATTAAAPAAPAKAPAAAPVAQPTVFPLKLPPKEGWSFAGFFGTFDQAQPQRGYQVYKEVCSNCHSMNLVAFRNLGDESGPHFTDDRVALAASFMVTDGPNDAGRCFSSPVARQIISRRRSPTRKWRSAASAPFPPDLSSHRPVRAADRGLFSSILDFFTGYQEAGPDYIHALLTGFSDPPAGITVPPGTYYNPYFLSAVSLKMPPPLMDGLVAYTDGSPMTVDQYAKDVSAFLMWTAEPHLVDRKEIGFRVLIFLIIFAGLVYMAKRKVWSKVAR